MQKIIQLSPDWLIRMMAACDIYIQYVNIYCIMMVVIALAAVCLCLCDSLGSNYATLLDSRPNEN